jgi:drug/metabolite transporter (DMT)-like permease
MEKTFNINDLFLLLSVVILATTNVLVKLALSEIGPLSFVGFRMVLTSLFMLGLLWAVEKDLRLNRRDFWPLCILGLFGYGSFHLLFTVGLDYTTSSDASILIATSPLYAAMLAPLLGAEKFGKKVIIGILISLCGVVIIVSKDIPRSFHFDRSVWGNLMEIGAAFSFAIFNVLAKPALERNSTLKVTTYSIIAGTVFLLPFTLREVVRQEWLSLSATGWFILAFCVVFTAGVSYTLWNRGIARIGAAKTQIYQNLIPVTTVSLAHPILGEALSFPQVLGGLVALIGVYIARRG